MDKDTIASALTQTAGNEKSRETDEALTALVAN